MLAVQGIAVGIATKIPPHNLGEVVAALEALVQQPDLTSRELMQHVPAPDFPTGVCVVFKAGQTRSVLGALHLC